MLNKVMLIGRLGNDPEVKYLPDGTAVANFNLATSETWKDKAGQKQEKTEWHRIGAFGKLAEVCGEYLTKGSLIYVEGKLQTRSWEDDKGKHYATSVIISSMLMLGKKNQSDPHAAGTASASNQQGDKAPDFIEDDIPF